MTTTALANAIFTLVSREDCEAVAGDEAMEVASLTFSLGVRMALEREPFLSPFDNEKLTTFWEAGYKEQVYADGWQAATVGCLAFECPYRDLNAETIWLDGYEASLAVRRFRWPPPQKIAERRKPDWQLVGF